ncbi:LysR family transcriptional regulator [Tenacibaculum agarivorans]|uniref:LysR family transcriptional regulator n=1 Tax=Tenacibaculum agarivorans TaxID=1908389 RepID=UPI00094BA6FA|nr:LysR family transcriptional regulator [Tenacibaculum agarivorans]
MSYQFELRHLRYFLAVAEDLHFRKAADRLYISQPGLSRQIKNLEEEIGVSLFERNNRRVTLTKAGLFLQGELQKHFNDLERIIEHTKLLHDGLQGDLKLGYVGSAMQEIIPTLLVTFRKKYPKILFSLKEMDNSQQITQLQSQDIDLGFVRMERVPRGLSTYPIVKEPFCLVLPENHAITSTSFKGIHQLKDESFILFDPEYSASYYEKVLQIFDDSGFTPIVTHNTIHSNSIYKLVAHNFGISIVPKSLQSDYVKGIKFIELNSISQRTVLSAVWNIENRNPILTNFLTEIKKSKF